MANEIQLYGDDTYIGATVTAKVYDDAGSQVGTDVSLSEVGSTGIHLGDMPTADKGVYAVRFYLAGAIVAQGEIHWNGTKEVTVLDSEDTGDGLTEETLNTALDDAISNIQVGSLIGSRSKTD